MLRGFGERCLLAMLFSAIALTSARAGDPAIEEPNGLFGAKLGYQQSGAGGGGSVLNGFFEGGVFRQCLNNDCGSISFGRTIVSGSKGQQSGFSAYGGGQFAMPLGHDFGAQLDGELGGFSRRGRGRCHNPSVPRRSGGGADRPDDQLHGAGRCRLSARRGRRPVLLARRHALRQCRLSMGE